MLGKLAMLGLAGALGSLSRYGLSGLVQEHAGSAFPWGTLAVNLLGCFLAGLFASLAEQRLNVSAEARIVVMVGFMGAFTTFSTFMLETVRLLNDAEWLRAISNLLMHNVVGALAVVAGLFLGRLV